MRLRLACAFALAFSLHTATVATAENAGEVNVYSYRQPYLINPLFKAFTEQTGTKVNVIFAEKGLIERIQAEGRNSPADVLLTVDVGNLTQATDARIAQPIESAALEATILPAYRGADNQWFGLTRRARVVYASKERVKLDKITYEDLADPKWRGKICIRSGQHVCNVVLIASFKLREFLASDKGQEMYADVNNEYPVKEGIPWSPLVKSWGEFKADPISLNDIASLREKRANSSTKSASTTAQARKE
jgi:ABC-type Fe3+ transport system substrate-binding protein